MSNTEALREDATRLLEAVDAETSPSWDCNSYHPKLLPAADALRAALAQPAASGAPVALIRTWHKGGEQHAELWGWGDGLDALPDGDHKVYTTAQPAPARVPPGAMPLLMNLADQYAKDAARAYAEGLYGTSKSYSAARTKRENQSRSALHNAMAEMLAAAPDAPTPPPIPSPEVTYGNEQVDPRDQPDDPAPGRQDRRGMRRAVQGVQPHHDSGP